MNDGFSLTALDEIVAMRAGVTDGSSYTASLVEGGVAKCARKLGEEATETIIAAIVGNRGELTKEAADVLYHLLVLLRASNVPLADVMLELRGRTAQSGLAEKAGRKPAAG
jgi:phosphoribosyl-ATP pyrophosphohydrolase